MEATRFRILPAWVYATQLISAEQENIPRRHMFPHYLSEAVLMGRYSKSRLFISEALRSCAYNQDNSVYPNLHDDSTLQTFWAPLKPGDKTTEMA